MAAYVLVGVDVADPGAYAEYTRDVPASLEPYGGRFIVRGGAYEVVEGTFTAPRIVLLEFPSLEQARAWYASDAYQSILPLRKLHAETQFLLMVEGAG